VGTTPDYVQILRERYPERILFLTDRAQRNTAVEETPGSSEEIVVNIIDAKAVYEAVEVHLSRHGLTLSGVACYDDESLILASDLASRYGLTFANKRAIWTNRSKYHSKRVWTGAGIDCPRVQTARDGEALEAVMDRLGLPLVLKPLTGSGSELVFMCHYRDEARKAFKMIKRGLDQHPDIRMYPDKNLPWRNIDPRQDVVVEERVSGPEYSCDFLLSATGARLVRLSGKIISPALGTGTAFLYYVAETEEIGIHRKGLQNQLALAARSLGFDRGHFMADFIIHHGKICFLEISPRPAGDCLPWLVLASSGIDTLGLTLDVAEGRRKPLIDPDTHERLAAVRLFSRREGILRKIDTRRLRELTEVVEVTLYRNPGNRIDLPPSEYGSRILGHIIFRPRDHRELAEEAAKLEGLVDVEVEQ
jgi:biotin carboxylase